MADRMVSLEGTRSLISNSLFSRPSRCDVALFFPDPSGTSCVCRYINVAICLMRGFFILAVAWPADALLEEGAVCGDFEEVCALGEVLGGAFLGAQLECDALRLEVLDLLLDLELVVRMQHYDGATCLLDVTSSLDVALYFASSGHSEVTGVVYSCRVNPDMRVSIGERPDGREPDWYELTNEKPWLCCGKSSQRISQSL